MLVFDINLPNKRYISASEMRSTAANHAYFKEHDHVQGIYMVIGKCREYIYIGESINMEHRFRNHNNFRHGYMRNNACKIRCFVFEATDKAALENRLNIEKCLIAKVQPLCNKADMRNALLREYDNRMANVLLAISRYRQIPFVAVNNRKLQEYYDDRYTMASWTQHKVPSKYILRSLYKKGADIRTLSKMFDIPEEIIWIKILEGDALNKYLTKRYNQYLESLTMDGIVN